MKVQGYKVRDARPDEAFQFALKAADAKKGIPKDSEHCLISVASDRVRRILKHWVGGKIAYFVFRDDPEWAIRFQIAHKSLGITRLFDLATDEFKRNPQLVDGVMVVFNAPSPANALGSRRGQSGTNVRGTGKKKAPKFTEPSRRLNVSEVVQ